MSGIFEILRLFKLFVGIYTIVDSIIAHHNAFWGGVMGIFVGAGVAFLGYGYPPFDSHRLTKLEYPCKINDLALRRIFGVLL